MVKAFNNVTRKYVYALPRIDETHDALGGALQFIHLIFERDNGSCDESQTEDSVHNQGWVVPVVRMPFGLTNAPSTFQFMMNSVLR
ncbi:LOW QUALITY PROTEIN: Transposable element [Phytophthora megakarya]|uniref:Transposable element n=1 Tax=Phytophthora megakarya TaxID=4795 RepID=A0A225WWF3_9STRA|nr:LOW QUALITY PROTEIN: Transposable element [Phytophthora megakarya]